MIPLKGIEQFKVGMIGYGDNRYRFVRNGILVLKLTNTAPRRFKARDKVSFRIDCRGVIVEDLKTSAPRERFLWEDIESLAAGEPETTSGALFQG